MTVQVDKDSSGAARKRNEPPKQQSQQPKLVRDKPEKILGVTKIQGELHFLVKYKNKARTNIYILITVLGLQRFAKLLGLRISPTGCRPPPPPPLREGRQEKSFE
jgi:hypothetical protein